MSSSARKRKTRSDSPTANEKTPDPTAAEEPSHRDTAARRSSARVRTPTNKQEAINSSQNEQLLARIKRLEQDNARLKKKAVTSASVRQDDLDAEDDADELPIESEEEQEYIAEARKSASTFRSRGIYNADGKEPQKKTLRRMDDPAARPATSQVRTPDVRRPSAPPSSTPLRHTSSRPTSAPPPPPSMIDPRLLNESEPLAGSVQDEITSTTPPGSPHMRFTMSPPPFYDAIHQSPLYAHSNNDNSSHQYRARSSGSEHRHRSRSGSESERSRSPPSRHASRQRSRDRTVSHMRSTPHLAAPRSSLAMTAPTPSRPRSSASTASVRPASASSRQRSESPRQQEHSVTTATKPPPFRGGVVPTGDAKASDYEPHATKLILTACRHFEALVLTEDPFPDDTVQETWAQDVWQASCAMLKLSYTLPERIKKMIMSRTSHARGALKDCIRPMVATTYGFSSLSDEATKAANRSLYERLLDLHNPEGPEPTFHYQDVHTLAGYARNEIVTQAIREQWFRNTDGVGLQLSSQFCPIREATLAIIFTAIEFCLDQWADGALKSESGRFTEKEYKPKYKAHLARIELWTKLNPTVTAAIRKQMHDDARMASGATPVLGAAPTLSATSRSRLQAELEEFAKTMG